MASPQARSPLAPLLGAAALLLAHAAVWLGYFQGFRLDVGSIDLPTPRYFLLAALLAFLGMPVVGCLAVAGERLLSAERLARWRDAWRDYPERRSLVFLGLLGVLVPLALQTLVLQHVPLTDDEGSYQFQARLMASFRLWVQAPPSRVFFNNAFLVNGERMYSQYFLGWPFLLAFGMKAGMPWLVNPLLSGATTVAVFQVARGWWGASWGRVAGVLCLASPLMMMGAATQMSHTATLFALAWTLFFVQRARSGAGPGASALVAFFFCLAFWTRPATAVGLGGPLLVWWAVGLVREGRPRGLARAGAFLAVAVPLGALFLVCNAVMNGSPWVTGYHAALATERASGYRFLTVPVQSTSAGGFWYFFVTRNPWIVLARAVTALFRLHVDGFGWPLGLGLVLLARSPQARWLAASAAGLWVMHIPLGDAGIDSFGPVHYSEAMLPLLLLSTDGLRTAWRWAGERGRAGLVPGAMAGLLLACGTMYLPPRWGTLATLARDIRMPLDFAEREVPDQSVLFVLMPLAPPCRSQPAWHFIFTRPNNSPDLDDPIIWANHLGVARDRELMRRFPGRTGFLIWAHDCQMRLLPLDQADPATFPTRVRELPSDFPEPARP